MRRRIEIGADQAFGRGCALDLGDQTVAACCALGLQRSAETAHRAGIASPKRRLAQRGDFLALHLQDLVELVGHQKRIQQSSKALASPLSIASAASSTPSRRSQAVPATTRAAAALRRTASR